MSLSQNVCWHRAGAAERVTLLKDPHTQHPTGKAYVQFQSVAQAAAAVGLTGSMLLQRVITVVLKPVKVPTAGGASHARVQDGPGYHHQVRLTDPLGASAFLKTEKGGDERWSLTRAKGPKQCRVGCASR